MSPVHVGAGYVDIILYCVVICGMHKRLVSRPFGRTGSRRDGHDDPGTRPAPRCSSGCMRSYARGPCS